MNLNNIPVSVIIPSYNNAAFLKDCILSIVANRPPAEIIIVDDCSTDNSLEVAKQLEQDFYYIKVIALQKNSGAAAARRIGFLNASHELVAWVDSDDILESNAIYDAYTKFSDDVDICIWDLWRLNSNGESFKDKCNPNLMPVDGRNAVLSTLGEWKIHAAGVTRKYLYLQAYDALDVDSFNKDEILTRIVLSNARKIVSSNKKYFYRINSNSTTSVISDRHLSHLRSEIWLLNFALTINDSPIRLMVKNSLKSAFKFFLIRKKFTKNLFFQELRLFIFSIGDIKEIRYIILLNPINLFIFIFLYSYIKIIIMFNNFK